MAGHGCRQWKLLVWRRRMVGVLLLAGSLFGASSAARAEDELQFPIAGYEVAGASFLTQGDIDAALASFVGPAQSFESIQRAVETLQQLLIDRGYETARVFLPEQEVEAGRIRLNVVVAVLGHLDVEGNTQHDAANVTGSVPALRPGVVPDMRAIAAQLRVANENPSKQTRLVFRQSRKDGEVDAVLRVADEHPLKFGFSLDNTGNEATGSYRVGALLQHANLFNADHAMSAQVITSPGHERDVLIAGVGYRLPLYRIGDSMDFAFGYSNVDSGSVSSAGGDYDISGSGRIASVRYNHYLPRLGDLEQKLILGFDRRAYSNEVTPSGTGGASLIPDITVRPVSLAWVPVLRHEAIDAAANLSYARNVPGGAHGGEVDFAQTGIRVGANPKYSVWRYGANLNLRVFGDWQLRGGLTGQWTDDLLISGEQFGIGGADSVRGFGERAVAADIGIRGGLEVMTPNIAGLFGWKELGARLLAFGDAGEVRQNRPLPGELVKERIASAGIGIRLSIGRSVSARLDAAEVIYGDGTTLRGDHRLHGQLFVVF